MDNNGNGEGVVIINVKYKECRKNHALQVGLNIVDGCMEFMPNGPEGSAGALTCSACGCHRNFHRRVEEIVEVVDHNF